MQSISIIVEASISTIFAPYEIITIKSSKKAKINAISAPVYVNLKISIGSTLSPVKFKVSIYSCVKYLLILSWVLLLSVASHEKYLFENNIPFSNHVFSLFMLLFPSILFEPCIPFSFYVVIINFVIFQFTFFNKHPKSIVCVSVCRRLE